MFLASNLADMLCAMLAQDSGFDRLVEAAPRGQGWSKEDFYYGLAIMCLVCLVIIAVVVFWYELSRRRNMAKAFREQMDRKRLDTEERDLLMQLVGLAGLHDPLLIFSDASAFGAGAAEYLRQVRDSSPSEAKLKYIIEMLDALCRKLGLHVTAAGEGKTLLSTSQLKIGTELILVPEDGEVASISATIRNNTPDGIILDVGGSELDLNQKWEANFNEGGTTWLFPGNLKKNEGGKYVLAHSDNPEFINRRSFPRIPVQCSAILAPFPLTNSPATVCPPKFVKGRLVEIAGPGIMVETPEEFPSVDKALFISELHPKMIISSLGRVRRVKRNPSGGWLVVMELVGLDTEDMAALTRETNEAASSRRVHREE